MVSDIKNSLRQRGLAFRKQLSDQQVLAHQQDICAHLITLLQTLGPCTVGLYYPVRREPNTLEITREPLLRAFEWALPVCSFENDRAFLQFARYSSGDALEPGEYSIPVPVQKQWVKPRVLLLPCVAFHRDGTRLGYGAGWYDKTLQHLHPAPITVGVAYSATESQEVFSEPHDCKLNHLVTEIGVVDCSVNQA